MGSSQSSTAKARGDASGTFVGDVVTIWLVEDRKKGYGPHRDMKLVADFVFIDPKKVKWKASKGSIVDGASIPRILASIESTPYVGAYRRASVLHDVACKEKTRPHPAVHRMFYYAMLAEGLSWKKAARFYLYVKIFGPKWDKNKKPVAANTQHSEETMKEYMQCCTEAIDEVMNGKSEGTFKDIESCELRAGELMVQRRGGRIAT